MAIAAIALTAASSCNKADNTAETTFTVQYQLKYEGALFYKEGITVELEDESRSATYTAKTDGSGVASFKVLPGRYNASVNFKEVLLGQQLNYNGTTGMVYLNNTVSSAVEINLNLSQRQQLIIKELYNGGCPKTGTTGAYSEDAYVIIYNNSEFEADATNLNFGFIAPYNAHVTNKYYSGTELIYEKDNWIPSYGAIWWFKNEVKIAPYSQIVVAIFGAIDHTQVQAASVDLSNPAYYWMSNSGVTQYTNAKYKVAETISKDNYLTTYPFTMGDAWALSNMCPAFFIGKMPAAEVEALSKDTEKYDKTMGDKPAFYVVKYPQANVVDALDAWSTANVAKSAVRFPASINTGYIDFTNQKGHSIYRNVDKEATEALEENAGKLVYNYAGGFVADKTDPSGIDAEASIANGAHIVYSDTNASNKDFHERTTASLKK